MELVIETAQRINDNLTLRFNNLPISLLSENDEKSNRNMRDYINTANMILIALVINNVSLLLI